MKWEILTNLDTNNQSKSIIGLRSDTDCMGRSFWAENINLYKNWFSSGLVSHTL